MSILAYGGIELNGYVYPEWATSVGWCVTCSSIIPIPLYMIYRFVFVNKGNLLQVRTSIKSQSPRKSK